MPENEPLNLEARILNLLESSPSGLTEKELSSKLGESEQTVVGKLSELKESNALEKRQVGNTVTWYPLSETGIKKVLIVEDDENINNLMKLSIGEGYEVTQSLDGDEAMQMISANHPDLVVLDLMLPGLNGIEICQRVKSDPALSGITIIIVSAADSARNRFEGLKHGADYYIKKPFDPKALRSLVNIFLRKSGKKFDPLVDLPDAQRLSKHIESLISGGDFEINNLRLANTTTFLSKHGLGAEKTLVRLVSQILQDKVQEWDTSTGFVGYIGEGEFIVGGKKNETELIVQEAEAEFERVLPFIYQLSTDKSPSSSIDLENIFGEGKDQPDRVRLVHNIIPHEALLKKRSEIQQQLEEDKKEIGEYSYEQLKQLVGSNNVDLKISRNPKGVQISISKKQGS